MNVKNEMNKPTEAQEQEALLRWVSFAMCKWPELELIYHIPNEGKRSRVNGASLKRQGLQKGVPDLCLPVARGGYHALYIEMKRKGGKPSREQLQWIEDLKKQGNLAVVCEGWEQAAETIKKYMEERL